MECTKKLILGSASPRRRELLEQIGLDFTVVTSDVEEKVTSKIPAQVVQELSAQKAKNVFCRFCEEVTEQSSARIHSCEEGSLEEKRKRASSEILVIGADTIVAHGDTILGKPYSKENAISMLKLLQGGMHQVYTSVSFIWEQDKQVQIHTFYEKTDVEVLPMTEDEITYYVNLNTCMDKAGAYGIQNEFACFVKGINGDYNNVVGLPVCRVYQELCKLGFLKL